MLLSTASTLSIAQKQGPRTRQKTHSPRQAGPAHTEHRGGRRRAVASSWHEGRSKFLETHPDQRPERKSRLSCPCPEL